MSKDISMFLLPENLGGVGMFWDQGEVIFSDTEGSEIYFHTSLSDIFNTCYKKLVYKI